MERRRFLARTATLATAPLLVRPARAGAAAEDPAATAWEGDLRRIGIWDLHAHPGPPGPAPDRRMESLLRTADRMGVERLCLFMAAQPAPPRPRPQGPHRLRPARSRTGGVAEDHDQEPWAIRGLAKGKA